MCLPTLQCMSWAAWYIGSDTPLLRRWCRHTGARLSCRSPNTVVVGGHGVPMYLAYSCVSTWWLCGCGCVAVAVWLCGCTCVVATCFAQPSHADACSPLVAPQLRRAPVAAHAGAVIRRCVPTARRGRCAGLLDVVVGAVDHRASCRDRRPYQAVARPGREGCAVGIAVPHHRDGVHRQRRLLPVQPAGRPSIPVRTLAAVCLWRYACVAVLLCGPGAVVALLL